MNNKQNKIVLTLSGGGYRATLFHLGIVKRIVELGLFQNISAISSVSGGSILNGVIGLNFDKIHSIDDFNSLVFNPIISLTSKNSRNKIIGNKIAVILNKLASKASPLIPVVNNLSNLDVLQKILNSELFHEASLDQLTKSANIIINATDLNNGVRFRFNRDDYGGYMSGYCRDTSNILLSEAVASSASFPGLFYPNILNTRSKEFIKRDWDDHDKGINTELPKEIYLADGGIYDNLGFKAVERELKSKEYSPLVIMCDASRPFITEVNNKSLLAQVIRSNDIISEQNAKDQRKFFMSRVVDEDRKDHINGVYVGLRNSCDYIKNYETKTKDKNDLLSIDYGLPNSVHELISQVRTDLNTFTEIEQIALVYHGQTALDLTLRKWKPELYRNLKNIEVKPINLSEEELLKGLKKSHKRIKI